MLCSYFSLYHVYLGMRLVDPGVFLVTISNSIIFFFFLAGNEGAGLRSAVERCCSTMLTIAPTQQLPMGFDSLNVAVATGILLHQLQKQ